MVAKNVAAWPTWTDRLLGRVAAKRVRGDPVALIKLAQNSPVEAKNLFVAGLTKSVMPSPSTSSGKKYGSRTSFRNASDCPGSLLAVWSENVPSPLLIKTWK